MVDLVLRDRDEDHVNEEDNGGEKRGEEAYAEREEGGPAGNTCASPADDEERGEQRQEAESTCWGREGRGTGR